MTMHRAALLSFALLCAACSPIANVPSVSITAPRSDAPEALIDRIIAVSVTHGWPIVIIQANRGRLALRARHDDELGHYVFAIELTQNGRVLITPYGPRVERSTTGGYFLMPIRLRDEFVELTAVVERAVRPRG
jgi:hypothetical protein